MSNNRQPLYYDLFIGLSDNDRVIQGLQFVASTESQCSPLVRKMAQTILDEIEFFKELKRSKYKLTIWRPPRVELDSQQVMAMERLMLYPSDPLLQELAKAVIKEIKYNQGYRRYLKGLVCFAIFACIAGLLVTIGLIVWEVNFKPPKRRY